MDDIYEEDNGIAIHVETFDTDYDNVGFEPKIVEDDSDEEAANEYGY